MKALLAAKVGVFLVISFVLVAWMLLAASPVLAQRVPTAPSCPNSSEINKLTDTDDETTPNPNGDVTINITTDTTFSDGFSQDLTEGGIVADNPATEDADESIKVNYFWIRVPALTVGELSVDVTENTAPASKLSRPVVRLCRGSRAVATHPTTSEASARAHATNPGGVASYGVMEPVTPGDYFVAVRGQDTELTDGSRIDSNTSDGDKAGTIGEYTLTITFDGVMPAEAGTQDEGSFTKNNQQDDYGFITSTPGLLTVETTGSNVDTVGSLYDNTDTWIAWDNDAGDNNNFQIIAPVAQAAAPTAPYRVSVEGKNRDERGDYSLKVDFKVAGDLDEIDTVTPNIPPDPMIERGRADYFFFTVPDGTYRFLTVETQKHDDVTTETNTKGTLFGATDRGAGQIATDDEDGAGSNFLIHAPVSPGSYIVKVEGQSSSTAGKYTLSIGAEMSISQGSAPDEITRETQEITLSAAAQVDPYSITVKKSGTLQVKTTGNTDTVGVLYGPAGQVIATDDNSGESDNFKITQYVEAGQHIVTVEGQTRDTTGNYVLVIDFIEGARLDSGARVAELDAEVEDLEAEVARLESDLEQCEQPVAINTRGSTFEDPANDSVRSGIGLIRGWVCAANEVEIQIDNAQGRVATLDAAYGTSRPDTNGMCGDENNGFGLTYNFNHLPEGEYTIRAMADDLPIGREANFTVVHLTTFENDDRFLRGLEGECRAENFPADGQTTTLKWEQSLQNFSITGVE